MSNLDSSLAQTKVRALIPAFAAEYADCPSFPQEDIELMILIKLTYLKLFSLRIKC